MAELDPFTQTFDALWKCIDESPIFDDLIRPRNRIKYNGTNRDPEKEQVQVSDFPELVLTFTGAATINLNASSCHCMFQQQFNWVLTSGDKRVAFEWLPVRFALLAAMAAKKDILKTLTFKGENFVKKVQLSSVADGMDMESNRNVNGWGSVLTGQIDMHFSAQSLAAYLQLPGSSS